MKKELLMGVFICLASGAAGQGTIHFANDTSSLIYVSPGVPVSPGAGAVQLVWAPQGTAWHGPGAWSVPHFLSINPGWQTLPESRTTIGPTPGLFDGSDIAIPTIIPGEAVQVSMFTWLGTGSFDDALIKALPEPFTIDTGNPLAGEPPAFIVGPGKFQGFVLPSIPEPGSLALLGLGTGLLLLRRQMRVNA